MLCLFTGPKQNISCTLELQSLTYLKRGWNVSTTMKINVPTSVTERDYRFVGFETWESNPFTLDFFVEFLEDTRRGVDLHMDPSKKKGSEGCRFLEFKTKQINKLKKERKIN